MNWKQLKDRVEKEIKDRNLDPEMVEIDWIDIGWVDEEDITVDITIGSDDRVEMTISD